MKLEEIKKLDQQYYMPVFGERFPVCFVDGHDACLVDTEGREYRDFLGGIAVSCLGYSDQGLIDTVCNQAKRVLHTSNYFYIEPQAKAAELVCQATGMDKVFFANSGGETVEGALKLARKYFYEKGQKKYKVITMQQSFHGRTLATLSATGQPHFQEAYRPLMPAFVHVPFNDIAAVEAAIDEETCAVLTEPILGEGGVIPAQDGYLQQLRALCDEKGILLIADEIQTGVGRTGSFLACQYYGVKPDIVTLAKGLGGGVPIGAFLATDEVAQAFHPSDHGSTFGGNPLATSAAAYVVEKLTSSGEIFDHVRQMGAYLREHLSFLCSIHGQKAKGVRGVGLLNALALDESLPAKQVLKELLRRGFVAGSAGGNSLRFAPPFVVQKSDIDALASALNDIFSGND